MNDTALPTPVAIGEPSPVRAWFYLVLLSWQRQLRARQMVWIALTLLVFAVLFVGFLTLQGRWDLHNRRWPPGSQATKFELAAWNLHNHPGRPARDREPWPRLATAPMQHNSGSG